MQRDDNRKTRGSSPEADSVDIELGLRSEVTSVKGWLKELNMSQYLENFESNAISVQDLHELTSDLLKEMGIKPIGHRLTLLRGAKNMQAQKRYFLRNHVVTEFHDWTCCGKLDCFRRAYKITAATMTVIDPRCCSTTYDNVDVTMIRDINLHAGCCLSTLVLETTDAKLHTIPIRLCNDRAAEVEQIIRNLRERDQSLLGNNANAHGLGGAA
eukprot:CAMPEP_0195519124 /NCGR_PEP_ID=MMETSP0794_2-20130614/14416_1 /TAXON_ID=515487 /ORGANISM="Stephanopyxis turris, Strain CCMP 815" /LENGTH=212 /DNA_ID=CAMNT_0040648231 /DNA_START=143 /DNA_END=778 /DNA_ORIENTATION=-